MMVVLRLVGGNLEGQWHEIDTTKATYTKFPGQCETLMVATGSVEWDGDRCAEVYVPQHLLSVYRAEFEVQ